MAGRADNRFHESAVANASGAGPHAAEFLAHLEEIVESAVFCETHRSREFLSHVVGLALRGEFERLKERMIGIEIFHREADYDTSADAIVRVTANDVRKRLNQYYAENPPGRYQIHLRSGTYIPEFSLTEQPPEGEVEAPLPVESEARPELDCASEITEKNKVDEPVAEPQTASVAMKRESDPPRRQLLPGQLERWRKTLIVTVLLLSCTGLGWYGHAFLGRISGLRGSAGLEVYRELLGPIANDPHMGTEIVISNPRLFLYRGSQDPVHIADHESQSFPLTAEQSEKFASGANDIQRDFAYHHLALITDDYTGMGEAKTLYGLGGILEGLGRPAHLSEARFLNWDTAQANHMIILGSPHLNGWVQNNIRPVDFSIEHDLIRNNHPAAGERAVYARVWRGTELEDYGLIWMSQLSSGVRVLVLAGVTSGGTAGVGNYFADPKAMRQVVNELRKMSSDKRMPSNWQVLLRIEGRDNIPLRVQPVAYRVYAENQ